ncbi:MAG: hypothetical protein LQ337_003693 [Flavoplaca oasis]|nr:MAG: hypothetical protein LQ337_003693 [Flavoplaca oasis]
MPSEIAWGTQIPQLNGTLYICATPRATFREQLAAKNAELARINALNDEYVKTIEVIKCKRVVEREELNAMTAELQWFSVNYPTLEGANAELQDQSARASIHLGETQDELDKSRNEACGLRKRLMRLNASLPPSPTHTPLAGKVRARSIQESSELQMQLEILKGQKKEAVADRTKAEAERDQAIANVNKAVEESDRKAASFELLLDSSDKAKMESQERIADLETRIVRFSDTVKTLDAEKEKIQKALDSSVTNSGMLESTILRLEKELKETKDDVKDTEKAANSSLEKDALIQARDNVISQLEEELKTLEREKSYANDLDKKYASDLEAWENSKNKFEVDIQSLQNTLAARTTQYDNATREYNHNHQSHQCQLHDLTHKLRMACNNHDGSARHVNHLKQTLGGAMKGLGVLGDLESPSGLDAIQQHLEHSLGRYTGYQRLIHGVIENSGIVGSLNAPEDFERVQKTFKEFFNSFAPMKLTPKLIKSIMEELTTLQQFKKHMLASQNEGKSEDLESKLRQTQANLKLMSDERLKARNEASEKQTTIINLRKEVDRLRVSNKGGVRASQIDQSKIRKMEEKHDELQKKLEELGSRKDIATQQVEDLDYKVKTLHKEKKDLETQKWKLLAQYNKVREEGPTLEEQSPGAEKRCYGNDDGDDLNGEPPRSSKQVKKGRSD